MEEADGVTLEASRQAVAQAHKVPRTEQRLIKRAQKGPEEAAQAQQQQQSPPVKMLVHAQVSFRLAQGLRKTLSS